MLKNKREIRQYKYNDKKRYVISAYSREQVTRNLSEIKSLSFKYYSKKKSMRLCLIQK